MTVATPAATAGVVPQPRLARTRTVALRALYGLYTLWALVMATGVVRLAAGTVPDGPWHFAAASSTPWKMLSLTLPALLIAVSAGRNVVAVQALALGHLSWILAQAVAPQAGSTVMTLVVNAAVLWLGPWFLLSTDRLAFFRLRARPDWLLVALAAAALVPLALWARTTSTASLPATPHDLDAAELRFDMTGLPIVLAGAFLMGALRLRVTRWPALAAGVAASFVGVVALAWPDDYASPGRWWGLALVVTGLAIGVAAITRPIRPRRSAATGG